MFLLGILINAPYLAWYYRDLLRRDGAGHPGHSGLDADLHDRQPGLGQRHQRLQGHLPGHHVDLPGQVSRRVHRHLQQRHLRRRRLPRHRQHHRPKYERRLPGK